MPEHVERSVRRARPDEALHDERRVRATREVERALDYVPARVQRVLLRWPHAQLARDDAGVARLVGELKTWHSVQFHSRSIGITWRRSSSV